MGSVSKIVEMTQYTKEIGGVDFVLRRINPMIALRVYGKGLFGLVRAANTPVEARSVYLEKTDDAQHQKHIREMLRLCMVSPRLGDVTDGDADTITFDDLDMSGYAAAVVAELTKTDDLDFSGSCAEGTDSTSQEISTGSASDTESGQAI